MAIAGLSDSLLVPERAALLHRMGRLVRGQVQIRCFLERDFVASSIPAGTQRFIGFGGLTTDKRFHPAHIVSPKRGLYAPKMRQLYPFARDTLLSDGVRPFDHGGFGRALGFAKHRTINGFRACSLARATVAAVIA